MEFFWIILFTFIISALVKGWSGFGTNLIAMPFLIAFLGYTLTDSVTIVISVNVFMNIAILIENKKFNIKSLSNIKLLVVFGIIFNFVGVYFLKDPTYAMYLKIIAGAAIILAGVNKIITNYVGKSEIFKEKTMHRYFIPTGIISGLFNGIAGLGGLPLLIMLTNSDLPRDKFRTTLVSYFFVMNVVAIIGYLVAGNYSMFVLEHIGIFVVPAVLFCMIGVYLSRRVSDKIFSNVMLGVLLFMGINLLVNGITGENILNYIFK